MEATLLVCARPTGSFVARAKTEFQKPVSGASNIKRKQLFNQQPPAALCNPSTRMVAALASRDQVLHPHAFDDLSLAEREGCSCILRHLLYMDQHLPSPSCSRRRHFCKLRVLSCRALTVDWCTYQSIRSLLEALRQTAAHGQSDITLGRDFARSG